MQIAVVATGGTIASRAGADGRPVASLDARSLVDGVPELASDGTLLTEDLVTVNSWALTTRDMERIAAAATGYRVADPPRAVIVTHGTDTMEETAFRVDLAIMEQAGPPVVFTGAMRPADAADADGLVNLQDAVDVARAPQAQDVGCVVVMDGAIHAAAEVAKRATDGLGALVTTDPRGPLGHVVDRRVEWLRPPPTRPPGAATSVGPIELVSVHPDLTADLIDHVVSRGARGLVVQGTGLGNVPPPVVDGISRAIGAGVPVVIARRPLEGRTDLRYGGPGGGGGLAALGAIGSGSLSAHKARIALGVALARDPDIDAVRRWFAAW